MREQSLRQDNEMLNSSFSETINSKIGNSYVASDEIVAKTLHGNQSMATGSEYRLQTVYGNEIWKKLERAGITPEFISRQKVLEVCAGTGLLTYHLLSRCIPKSLTVNDISGVELNAARNLLTENFINNKIEYIEADMHNAVFNEKFNVVIGNSFLHHFHNVPKFLNRIYSIIDEGGVFISIHEPTPMTTIVESGKIAIYPFAVLAPQLINNIARKYFRGHPDEHDIWLFEPSHLKQMGKNSGFSSVTVYPWHLFRPMMVNKKNLHLSIDKPRLSEKEIKSLKSAIQIDSILNKFLPARCFGSVMVVFRK